MITNPIRFIKDWIVKIQYTRRNKNPNPYAGLFRDWSFGASTAISPDGDYQVWTRNGFYHFKDGSGYCAFLSGLPREHKMLLWKALKQDQKESAIRRITQFQQNNIVDVEN